MRAFGYAAYEILPEGEVFSFRRSRFLTPHLHKSYWRIAVVADTGQHVKPFVHQLVALAWIGPCPLGYEVRHWDGNKLNNSWYNLLYGTKQQNIEDSRRLQEPRFGAILSEADIAEIRYHLRAGISGAFLARQFGVCESNISAIKHGVTWQQVA